MSREVRASSLIAEARLGHARSPLRFSAPFNGTGDAMHPGEEKETMRGLNERLADYLCQVRLLEEANSRLEAQIKKVLTEKRAAGQRDWSGYERTISTLKDQIKEMIMDNARILLQLDNGKLAADDFKVKFEAECAVRCAVEEDIAKLRKMIDDTHISSMQLESHIEILTEELIYLKNNHEEDVASIKGQIKNSSVDVQMEAAKGQDLSETIDNIRKQYDKAVQKNREETEAWYQNKFENISAEVSRNTDALQQGKSELNELRRQKQGLEIELQGMHSMNHSLEDTLNDTLGRYSQNVNSHNRVIQQLEAELADVHAQVLRQGAEYQALLNIKSKLEEEIATYHGLLEGTGLPSNYMGDSELDEDGDFRGMGAREELDIKDVVPPEDGDLNDKGTFEDAPRNLNPDPTLNNKIVEEQIVSEKDLELNAANIAMNKQHDQEEDGQEIKEDRVILKEIVKEETISSTEVEVQVKQEEEKVSPVLHTQVEEAEKAVSLVVNTQVEKTEISVVNTMVEMVEEVVSPVVEIRVEKMESTLVDTQAEKVEKTEIPEVHSQVEKMESPVVNTQAEKVVKTEIPEVHSQVEKMESPVVNTQAEKVEKTEIPEVHFQVEKVHMETTHAEEKVPLKPAVENNNAAEEKKEDGEDTENPEAEPLKKVEE
ncbi:hypothetical protein C0J50_0107 [Silurus asotus]|uniref:IF rod domain-containing protein n=1 Tax=Silurus asotus TaxID=30991 RepID=A0AAD5AFM7_SILAS|nr:hypothetical protein C0J50_0107 [Silurus asotus]